MVLLKRPSSAPAADARQLPLTVTTMFLGSLSFLPASSLALGAMSSFTRQLTCVPDLCPTIHFRPAAESAGSVVHNSVSTYMGDLVSLEPHPTIKDHADLDMFTACRTTKTMSKIASRWSTLARAPKMITFLAHTPTLHGPSYTFQSKASCEKYKCADKNDGAGRRSIDAYNQFSSG